MPATSLADEKYLLFTTFKRNGDGVPTPVWAVPLEGGRIGFTTGADSWKVKRLAHTAAVTVQPCSMRGTPVAGTSATAGTAKVVKGPELEGIRARIASKYGIMAKLTQLGSTLATLVRRNKSATPDCGVVITLDPA